MFKLKSAYLPADCRIISIFKNRRIALLAVVLLLAVCSFAQEGRAEPIESQTEPRKPNVLFIAVDDLNDWTTLHDKANPIRTPHIERLARRGVLFTHAYCSAPACNPSRVATLTGLCPSSTGVYGNKSDWRKALPRAVTIPQHFMAHGYLAVGAGKIFHHHFNNAFHDDASFDDFQPLAKDPAPPKKLNGITNWVGGRGGGPTSEPFDWGAWPPDEKQTPDAKTVDYACRFLKRKHDKPFFLAVGIFRPHSPWYAPPENFAGYELDKLVMPEVLEGDTDDLPSGGLKVLREGKPFLYKTIVANNQLKEAIQAYQACATFADKQIGRLLDALGNSAYGKDTIIVLWSDHGFHLGEKNHWEKFALWEKTTRSPLIFVAPGVARRGARCDRPVSLLDIYPTLIELCGLSANASLEGVSLMPLLKNPQAQWGRPAVTTWGPGNHSVRSQRWRYIKYEDGSEELYDHRNDLHEWTNLAGRDEHKKVILELRKWLPKKDARQVADMVSNLSPY
ncbi:MAG: sulfatase [Pirellulales bacterium]|nr:sulfatase [Pirellulales bacterium]